MIRSMTGMASTEKTLLGHQFKIDIRSYNHRFLDIKLKLPPSLQSLEENVRKILRGHLNRGRVEVNVKIQKDEAEIGLEPNPEILDQVRKLSDIYESKFGRPLDISLRCLMNYPDFFIPQENSLDGGTLAGPLFELLEETGGRLGRMREEEGGNLKKFLIGHIEKCLAKIRLIDGQKHLMAEAYQNRLSANLSSLGLNLNDQDPRVMQELGFCMDRCDISEEINRFHSHIRHFYSILEENGPVGKKLDFLSQELNRETNTICSKSESASITQTAIEIKSEIESFREQIQNIE